MAKLASSVYGEALFSLAVEEEKLDLLMEEAALAEQVFQENPEFTALMGNPRLTGEEKVKLMEEAFGGRVSQEMTGFLTLLVKKGRFSEQKGIFSYFFSRAKEYKKIGVVQVTSAVELTEEWRQRIRQKLLDTTAYEELEISYEVEKELMGGLIIRIGDRVVDTSIRSRLEKLTGELMKISLEAERAKSPQE